MRELRLKIKQIAESVEESVSLSEITERLNLKEIKNAEDIVIDVMEDCDFYIDEDDVFRKEKTS